MSLPRTQMGGAEFWRNQLGEGGHAFRLTDALLFEALDAETEPHRAALSSRAGAVARKIAKGQDIGVFTVVAAALTALLGRYTGESVVTVEVPRSQNTDRDGDLPLVVTLGEDGTWKDLLAEVQRVVTASYRYQGAAPAERNDANGRSDVFLACPALHGARNARRHHALAIHVHVGGSLELELTSPNGALPRSFLTELVRDLDALVVAFESLDQARASFERILEARVREQTSLFNRTQTSFPNVLPEAGGRAAAMTVVELFELQVRTRPEARALVCNTTRLTYAELDAKANRLAAELRARYGIARGDVVASLSSRSEWAIVAFLAVLKLGAVFLPLSTQLADSRIRWALAQAKARALLTVSDYFERVRGFGEAPALAMDIPSTPEEHGAIAGSGPIGADPAYIIYTSGSTGTPKGVLITHEGLANTIVDHIERFRITPADRYLQFLALSFDGFILDIFMTLCAGAALVIADEETIRDPARLMVYVDEQAVTVSTITPSYLKLLDPECFKTLRLLVSAGEVLSAELAQQYAGRLELYNGYGPTEASINTSLHRVDPARCRAPIPIGGPSANKQIHVVNDQLALQPIGVVGEICIAGAGLAVGYLNDPELTRAKFVADPRGGEGRWYRSGDYGAWTPDGELLFKGRVDNQVKVNGYRIDVGEIQAAMDAIPWLRQSHVATWTTPRGTEIIAFVQPRAVGAPEENELRRQLEDALPRYMIPHRFITLETWPLTPNGKIDTAAILELAERASGVHDAEGAPTTPTEQVLCTIWKDVLGCRTVGIRDNFFSLGGDSIRLIQTAHKANKRGIAMEVGDIVNAPTVQQLAQRLDAAAPTAVDSEARVPLHLAELSAAEREIVPPGVEDAYPAAWMQSLMIERYAEDRRLERVFLGCAEWRFEDPTFSEEAMIAALQRLYDTNRALRSSFVRGPGGRDVLLVRRPSPLAVARTDLRVSPPASLETFFWDRIAEEAAHRFDPYSREPLIRFHLYRTADTRCSLFVSFHHAILDGWSGIELRNALVEYYFAAKAGSALTARAREADSYKEFVAIEQATLRSPEANVFWRAEIASEEGMASVRSFGRGVVARRNGGEHGRSHLDFDFPSAVTQAALEHSAREGITLKAVFLSAVSRGVMETFHIPDLVIGVVSNGRSEKLTSPFESTGLFWNILPVRIASVAGSSPERVDVRLKEVARHGNFPLKGIEDILGERLFMPLFNFVHFHNARAGAEQLREGVVQSRFHFPLTFFIKVKKPSVGVPSATMRIEVDRSVVAQRDVERVLERIADTLAAMSVESAERSARSATFAVNA